MNFESAAKYLLQPDKLNALAYHAVGVQVKGTCTMSQEKRKKARAKRKKHK